MKGSESVSECSTALHATETMVLKKLSISISKKKSTNLSEL